MADGSWFRKGEAPPHVVLGQKGEMLQPLSPLDALRRMEYQFALDHNRFNFCNGDVPVSAYQFRGACLLAWGAFYCKLPHRHAYAEALLPISKAKALYPQLNFPVMGAISCEIAIYNIMREKNHYWTKRADICAAVIPYLIDHLLILNPALV